MTRREEAIERAAFRRYVHFTRPGFERLYISAWHEMAESSRELFRKEALDAGVVDRYVDEIGIYHYDIYQSTPWITGNSVWSTDIVPYLERIAH